MTRRELLGLFGALPLVRLWTPDPRPIRFQWEWDQGNGGPAEYFELTIKENAEDNVLGHQSSENIIIRVPGSVRACEVPLPSGAHKAYHASVRAVNARGSSEPSNGVSLVV
jgi:hypothetical protein